jgi:signal transduction histidine kinase
LQEEATRQRNYSGDIAHELLTPLGTMHHQLEALEDGPARRALEADVTRMTEAVRALLELAVRQDRDVSLPVADLARLVREAVAERAPLCFTYGIGIVYEGPATGVSARVSPVLIRCLLLNLIDNAIRHSGSTWITVSLVPLGTIDIVDGGWIVPAKREALLARRERGGALTPGTGLGLALVRDIAERHDADLAITDRNGRHTVFRIDFRRCIAT